MGGRSVSENIDPRVLDMFIEARSTKVNISNRRAIFLIPTDSPCYILHNIQYNSYFIPSYTAGDLVTG